MMGKLGKKERQLYLGIWIALLIGVGLWKLAPRIKSSGAKPPPTVELSDSLTPLFQQAQAERLANGDFQIHLTPRPTYQETLRGQPRHLKLAYTLISRTRQPLSQSTAKCQLHPKSQSTSFRISRGSQTEVETIRLFLAH